MLDDGTGPLAIVVADSLMMPRELLDTAKELASKRTGIPPERILISATHSHSAPAAMRCLGSRPDPDYPGQLIPQLARAIELAHKNLAPARIGWAVVADPQHTNNRRWIFRPDRIGVDPFGDRNIRAMMHPGHESPDHVGPSGPVDPDISLLSVQSPAGRLSVAPRKPRFLCFRMWGPLAFLLYLGFGTCTTKVLYPSPTSTQ